MVLKLFGLKRKGKGDEAKAPAKPEAATGAQEMEFTEVAKPTAGNAWDAPNPDTAPGTQTPPPATGKAPARKASTPGRKAGAKGPKKASAKKGAAKKPAAKKGKAGRKKR